MIRLLVIDSLNERDKFTKQRILIERLENKFNIRFDIQF